MNAAEGYVDLMFRYEVDGGKWVGTCLELGTSTYARSFARVQEDLRKLVSEHLNLLEEAGERARFFRDHEIEFHPMKPAESHEVVLRFAADPLREEDALYQPRSFPVGRRALAPA